MKIGNKIVSIDFEFTGVAEPTLDLICCSFKLQDTKQMYEYWLHNDEKSKIKLANHLQELDNNGYVFLAHNVVAEASAFISLGLKPQRFKWIDSFAEFRCLSNHNHEYQYGLQLIAGKPTKTVPPKPKYEQTEEDKRSTSNKINHSYSQLVFKFLGKTIDTDHKEEMRQICIRGNAEEILANKAKIQDYCTSDIVHLFPSLREIVKGFKKYLSAVDMNKLPEDMLWRGETMARTAIIERKGYPIDYDKAFNFSMQVDDILNECAEDINSQFPEMGLFVWNKNKGTYTRKEKILKEWVRSLPFADRWQLTDKKDISLALDAFTQFFPFNHSYPRNNLGAQQVRYLKLKQMLNGFAFREDKKTFWDSVGTDKRVRSYLNPYGSLSGRYQPPSTGFLFLKPSWTRSLCVPPKGKMIVGIDYKSEEFLISGLFGIDHAMIQAYKSGDVYLAYGKDSGLIPLTGTKATHPKERQSSKSAVLGISYLMTKFGLAIKMTQDLGEEVSEDEAQEYIDSFNEAYSTHYESVEDFLESFADIGYHRLNDGWILFADNENFRSVANFPKQGQGGVILRKAIQLSQDAGLDVIIPLHDALYFEVDLNNWDAVATCIKCMREAFIDSYKDTEVAELAKLIMVDVEVWSPELEEGTKEVSGVKVKVEKLHKDERATDEYERFSKFFEPADWMEL